MMLGSTTTKVQIYNVNIKSVDGDFSMDINLTKVDKPQLMHLDNPNYTTLLKNHSYINGVQVNDVDVNPQLPVHVVHGASEYAAIKTKTIPRIGQPGQPVGEKPYLGGRSCHRVEKLTPTTTFYPIPWSWFSRRGSTGSVPRVQGAVDA